MKAEAFENVKNQIGLCGIWCGTRVVGNGTLRELTKRYEKIFKDYDLEELVTKDFSFKEFANGLTSIQATPLCSGCRKGGGRDNCEMRTCASGKGIEDCSGCGKQKACKNLNRLNHMRTGAQHAGLFLKTRKADQKRLIAKWMANLGDSWPCCILFMDDNQPLNE